MAGAAVSAATARWNAQTTGSLDIGGDLPTYRDPKMLGYPWIKDNVAQWPPRGDCHASVARDTRPRSGRPGVDGEDEESYQSRAGWPPWPCEGRGRCVFVCRIFF